MERLLERLRKLRADVEAWLATLSPRERVLVGVAAAAVVLFVGSLVVASVSRGISAREGRVEAKTRIVSQVGKLAEGYRRAQAERQQLEGRLRGNRVPLLSHISQTGATLAVEVNDLRPSGAPVEANGVVEESVEVNLARIDFTRLARFVQALEGGPGVVKVRRIRVATRADDPQLVDATLVVATYTLKS
jgi:general secretion pathway protein M